MDKQIDIITHNPYRYLGVYSNSPTKERVASQGKIQAFLKVGKPISFPLDLPNLLPAIERTEENVAEAIAKLTLPADQIKYAQFWWMKKTDIDSIAFNHLLSGNIDVSKSVWGKKDNAPSLQNRIVLALTRQDYATAISCAENLYNNHASSFVTNIADSGTAIDGTTLAHSFLDTLMEETPNIQELLSYISDAEWKAYVAEKSITPLIDGITQAIATAQASRGKGPEARYKAGQKLMTSTKSALSKLKSLLQTTDIRYTTIADKLGEEILQCGIDYFNDSEDDDNAEKAMRLQSYALSVVVGPTAVQRCRENVDILKNIISELPPAGMRHEHHMIMEELDKFCQLPDMIAHALTLLNNTKFHLQSIRSKLVKGNPHYLKLSTLVVSNALHNVIEEVNTMQNFDSKETKKSYKGRRLYIVGVNGDVYILRLKATLEKAWEAISLMDTFDIEADFKGKYNRNRATLQQMCQSNGISYFSDSYFKINSQDTKNSFVTGNSNARVTSQKMPKQTPSNKSTTSESMANGGNGNKDSFRGCIVGGIAAILICIWGVVLGVYLVNGASPGDLFLLWAGFVILIVFIAYYFVRLLKSS